MANVASSPAIQAARFELTQARENMNTRLNSSRNLVKAFEHFDLNQAYFDKSREGIQQLIAKTNSLSKAISTLEAAGIDAGTTTITVPGRVWGVRQIEKPIVEVQAEIQSNLDQEVVKTGLRTLGIVKAPRFVFKMPEAPSGRTVAISTGVAGGIAAIGTGAYFHKEIAEGIANATPQAVSDFFANPGQYMPDMPDLSQYIPNMPDLSQYMPDMPDVSQYMPDCANTPDTTFCNAQQTISDYIPTQDQTVEFFKNPITIGVGAAVGVALAGAAIYKVVQNRKNQEAEAAVAKAPVEVAVEQPKTEVPA